MAKEDFEEFAYRSVIRMIIDNQFKPGDFLLETELAERLNISRTPVRQALSRLIAEGFLDKRKKKGCIIPVPDAEDAQQVFLARETIEGQTAAAAARSAGDAEIKELRLLIKKQETAFQEDKKETYSLINENFHMGIARFSKNKYLERYCRHIYWRSNAYIFFFDRYYRSNADADRTHLTTYQHRKIVDAIETHDAILAENYMKEHIRHTYELLFGPWK